MFPKWTTVSEDLVKMTVRKRIIVENDGGFSSKRKSHRIFRGHVAKWRVILRWWSESRATLTVGTHHFRTPHFDTWTEPGKPGRGPARETSAGGCCGTTPQSRGPRHSRERFTTSLRQSALQRVYDDARLQEFYEAALYTEFTRELFTTSLRQSALQRVYDDARLGWWTSTQFCLGVNWEGG